MTYFPYAILAILRSRVDDETIVVVNPELRGAVDEMLKGVDDRLKNHTGVIDDQLRNHTKDIDERFSKFQTEIRNDLKTHFENMEDLVKRAAEGYGATLERIERDLKSNKTVCDTRFEDHSAVLDNHKKRIAVLEQDKVS